MTTNNTFVVVDHNELSPAEIAFAERFGGRVIGQPGALKVAQLAYNMAKNPLRDRSRPIGIFFLAGPSRTGKSLTGVTLAEIFHNDPDALIRIQASDYTEDHQILDLKGAPPTYIGYRDPKDPKNKLEDHDTDPYSVISPHNMRRVRLASGENVDIVVLEEFEKSSADFYKFWMGVFDKGTARLGNGMVADFRNTIFIITSNIGMDRFEREQKGSIGFVQNARKAEALNIEAIVTDEMRRTYKPEFRNRLDAVVVFQPFSSDALLQIVDAELSTVQKRITDGMEAGKDFMFESSIEAREFLLRTVDKNVAELKRVINRDVLMPLGRLLSTGKLSGGDVVRLSLNEAGDALVFSVSKGSYGVPEHEKMVAKMGKKAGVVNLTLQREIRKAAAGAKSTGVNQWSVITSAEGKNAMMQVAADLLNTMENVLELKVINISYQRVSPFFFSVIVEGTREQMNLLARLHEEDEIAINPVNQKLLPAPSN
ncbi:MAG: AAA family ATPase [Candidatus Obscuribacterales bacterium]|nr:AAA family ATPase [Candidatus Obscuribacterales bacterium]